MGEIRLNNKRNTSYSRTHIHIHSTQTHACLPLKALLSQIRIQRTLKQKQIQMRIKITAKWNRLDYGKEKQKTRIKGIIININ